MITKTGAAGANVDWNAVDKATEAKRTYLVNTPDGREIFKLYKPSEAQSIFKQKGWTGKIVGILDKEARWKR